MYDPRRGCRARVDQEVRRRGKSVKAVVNDMLRAGERKAAEPQPLPPFRVERVETEYAYMLMRRACEEPGNPEAETLLQQGIDSLENVITLRGGTDFYPFHVLGSQGLSWVRRASLTPSDKRRMLDNLIARVEEGVGRYPRESDLKQLLGDLKKERLLTAVARP